jgi:predicted PurR-regulated permease PerM
MARTLQAIAFLVVAPILAWFLRGTLLLVFAGGLFGIALRGCAEGVARVTRVPVVPAVWLVAVLTATALAGATVLGGGALIAQWTQLWQTFRDAFAAMVNELARVPAIANALAAFDPSTLLSQSGAVLAGAGGVLSGTFGFALAIIVVIFVAIAGALEPSLYRDGFVALFPSRSRPRVVAVIDEIVRTLRTWLLARAGSMCITGLLVGLGLALLHIPLAGALGALAGVLAFIPNIGAFLAGAPAVIIAFAMNPRLALAVLIMYWAVHFIDDFFVSPLIERKMVRLPPILTLVTQIALAIAAGTLGVMLAAPIAVVSIVLVQRLWVDRVEGSSV